MNNKLLIVDDDPDILEPITMLFESEGFRVNSLIAGKEIYSKITIFKPNLILLDILMSGTDGREICKNLKSNKDTKKLPIILMSAHPSAQKDALDCGANDFIAKPFEINELIIKVNKNLNS